MKQSIILMISITTLLSILNIQAQEPTVTEPSGKSEKKEGKTSSSKSKRQKYALVVGVNDFEDTSHFGQLSFAVRDARSVASNLEKDDYAVVLMTSDKGSDVRNLAYVRLIRQNLENIAKRAEPGDLILFYFSGHGLKKEDLNYLIAIDSYESKLAETSISVKHVSDIIEKSQASHKVVIIDACRNQPNKGIQLNIGHKKDEYAPRGSGKLYSTCPGCFSYEPAGNETDLYGNRVKMEFSHIT